MRKRAVSAFPLPILSLIFLVSLLLGVSAPKAAATGIAFVQVNSSDQQTSASAVTVTFTHAQTAGDLNVVVVGWNDATAHVSSVTDSSGNSYAIAVGPTVESSTATQVIYYATNIGAAAAGSNVVHVAFNTAASYPDIRIAEYSGISPANAVDVFSAAQGSGSPSSSGSVTTKNANDLLFGANLVQHTTTGAGPGFTSRIITNPDEDILEDSVVSTTGGYSATAPVTGGAWIMQMVAFRAAASSNGIKLVQHGSVDKGGAATSSVAVTLSGVTSGDLLTCSLTYGNNGGTTLSVSDSLNGAWSVANAAHYNSNITQTTGQFYFANSKSGTVTVIGEPAGAGTWGAMNCQEWSGAAISSPLDQVTSADGTTANPSSGSVTTTTSGELVLGDLENGIGPSAGSGFSLVSSTPSTGLSTEYLIQSGAGPAAATWTLPATGWTAQVATFRPATGGGGSPSPTITSLSPATGPVGTAVTITGTNFGTTQGTGTVTFNGTLGTPSSWSATSVVVPAPSGATTGSVVVTAGGAKSNAVTFTVIPAPAISALSQISGPVGTFVTITGANFGASQGMSAVTFNGAAGSPLSWSATSIIVPVPSAASTGPVVVSMSSLASNGVTFTVLPLVLPTQTQVLAAMENVNNYWIANNKPGNADWDQATYFTGDLAAYTATGQANYLNFAESWATYNSYSLCGTACGEGPGGNTTTFADYQAAGQVYIRLYQLTNTASDLSGITESISGMVNSTVDNEWTWIDAINMSMPDFVELGLINNDTSYYTKMYALYSYAKYTVGLYDSNTGLWWENAKYVNTSEHWSRGNGWVFAAHAKILSVLPTSDPHYAEYLSTFTTMAQALAASQQPGGYWNQDLTGTDIAGPESSGTSFFLYGFAWGLNNGVLDQRTYLPVVEKAWNFLANEAIQPSGLFGYVQPAVLVSTPPAATSTADFGVGAFLLAAPQLAQLAQ
jgi:unsaturated rhamnogalacturonyl hydrolase